MGSFEDRESKVLTFMEEVDLELRSRDIEDEYRNTDDYKLKVLKREKENCKDLCLDKVFRQIYKDAIPLNDDYKSANGSELDGCFDDFIQRKCPKGIEWYVKEGIKKKSPFATRVLEAVDELVANEFTKRALDVDKLTEKDLIFSSEDDVRQRADEINEELGAKEISNVIGQNVKDTAMSEITRAKREKERQRVLEDELSNDARMVDTTAIESYLQLHDMEQSGDYTPTLFEAVMIDSMRKVNDMENTDNIYLYNAMSEYGRDESAFESVENPVHFATPEELAFVEAVKEYTGLSMLKALRLQQFTPERVAALTTEYYQE